MDRAIEAMARARRVEFYGFGASGAVASDAQHKFFPMVGSLTPTSRASSAIDECITCAAWART